MAIFDIPEPEPSILDSIQRIPYTESSIDPKQVRVQEAHGLQLVFFKDYQRIMESSSYTFLQMVNSNNLDVDRVGIVLEEVDVINNPHYLTDAKHYVNPKKLYIRPMNTKRGKKLLETAILHLEMYGDPSLFDQFVEKPLSLLENERIDSLIDGLNRGLKSGVDHQKEELAKSAKSAAKKAAVVAGGIYAINKAASHFTQKYADEDARKHPFKRSDLIKKLRILRGKLPEYESKYQRAEREKWANRGVIGKIIYKIKTAISNIRARL